MLKRLNFYSFGKNNKNDHVSDNRKIGRLMETSLGSVLNHKKPNITKHHSDLDLFLIPLLEPFLLDLEVDLLHPLRRAHDLDSAQVGFEVFQHAAAFLKEHLETGIVCRVLG